MTFGWSGDLGRDALQIGGDHHADQIAERTIGPPAETLAGLGGVAEEEALPGVVVKWSADARDALREVSDAYLRRRAKA